MTSAPAPGSIAELREARELLWSFVRRDLIVRYRNALFGVGWAVASPVLQMLVFAVIFTRVVRVETGMPYPLFVFSGLVAWTLTASALRAATTSLSGNAALVAKVYFPRAVLPVAAVVVAVADFCVALPLLGAMMAWYDVGLAPAALLLPLVIAVQLAFTVGVALALAAANLYWRDVRYVFEVAVTVWMFATAVVYPLRGLEGALGAAFALNPMTPIVEAYRDVLLRGVPPSWPDLGYAVAVAAAALLGGAALFRRADRVLLLGRRRFVLHGPPPRRG